MSNIKQPEKQKRLRKARVLQQESGPSITVALSHHMDDDQNQRRPLLDKRLRITLLVLGATVVILLVGLIMPKGLFDETFHNYGYNKGYTFAWFVRDLSANANMFLAMVTGNSAYGGSMLNIVISYVVIILCGAGLALCGVIYQGTFRNVLVSPSTLGVMSGASLGMALWVALFFSAGDYHGLWFEMAPVDSAVAEPLNLWEQLWNSYSLALCSFVGCIVVVAIVLLVIGVVGRGSSSGLLMIITGQVIGAIMGSIVSTMRYYFLTVAPDSPQTEMLRQLQISSFYRSYGLIDVFAVAVPVAIMFFVVMRYRNQLMLLAFSEEEARTLGVETRKMRYLIIGLATLVTAIIVSFCGRVGFVGFMLPLLARRVVGPNFTYLVPLSMAGGGCFVLTAYILTTVLLGPGMATMSGMFISIGGTVVFLVTAIRGKGANRGAI